jgi:hypothetical protein
MRRISLGCALALWLAGAPAVAQQKTTGRATGTAGEQDVLGVIGALFTALKAKDTAKMRSLHDSGARLVLTSTRDGQPRIRSVPLDEFLGIIARNESAIEERIFEPQVRIDDNLATVWNRYEFLVDGKPDHCGVDAFQLARFADGWKVIAIADTQRPCEGASGRQ